MANLRFCYILSVIHLTTFFAKSRKHIFLETFDKYCSKNYLASSLNCLIQTIISEKYNVGDIDVLVST